MNLFPEDLGEKRARALFFRRVGCQPPVAQGAPRPIGTWGRLWLGRRAGVLSPEEALASLNAVRWPARLSAVLGLLALPLVVPLLAGGLHHNPPEVLFYTALDGAWVWLFTTAFPQDIMARQVDAVGERPLTAQEVASLLPLAQDELERAYLTLILDVTRQEVAPAAGADLRPALRALGDAIDGLPATRVVGIDSPDIMTEVLRRTAQEALAQAQEEHDRVVAASLVRRAEALQRRADATARAGLLTRRFAALRQEMAAQTEALRAGLAAYYTGANDVVDLTRLAEDVRRVAAEAQAITAATEEVDALLTSSPTVPIPSTAEAPARLQLGTQ